MAIPNAAAVNVNNVLRQVAQLNESQSSELYDEEEADEQRKLDKRKELLSQLPEYCTGFAPPEPSEPRPPAPIRIVDAAECFKICPKVITRAEWRARPPAKQPDQMMFRVRPAVFKETDCPNCTRREDCEICIRTLQQYQMDYLEFSDIAFSFLIGEDGNIYEGRGWGNENEKARGFSGIAYLGYHSMEPHQEPSDAMLKATYDLIMCGVVKGFIANPFDSNAFSGTTPLELIKEFLTIEEDVDYRTKPEDVGLYNESSEEDEEE